MNVYHTCVGIPFLPSFLCPPPRHFVIRMFYSLSVYLHPPCILPLFISQSIQTPRFLIVYSTCNLGRLWAIAASWACRFVPRSRDLEAVDIYQKHERQARDISIRSVSSPLDQDFDVKTKSYAPVNDEPTAPQHVSPKIFSTLSVSRRTISP